MTPTSIGVQSTQPPVLPAVDDDAPGALTGAEDLLPDPLTTLASSGDVGAEITALAVKSGETQRHATQAARDADEAIADAADAQQVQAMRDKASDMRVDAFLEGGATVAQGVGELGSGFAASSQSGAKWKGASEVASAGLKIAGGLKQADEANEDASAAQAKGAADRARSAAQDMHDASKAAGDYVNQAIDFYREYSSSQGQSLSAAVHRS